jgi:hypothetical protein
MSTIDITRTKWSRSKKSKENFASWTEADKNNKERLDTVCWAHARMNRLIQELKNSGDTGYFKTDEYKQAYVLARDTHFVAWEIKTSLIQWWKPLSEKQMVYVNKALEAIQANADLFDKRNGQ